jgi:hypothetical protein
VPLRPSLAGDESIAHAPFLRLSRLLCCAAVAARSGHASQPQAEDDPACNRVYGLPAAAPGASGKASAGSPQSTTTAGAEAAGSRQQATLDRRLSTLAASLLARGSRAGSAEQRSQAPAHRRHTPRSPPRPFPANRISLPHKVGRTTRPCERGRHPMGRPARWKPTTHSPRSMLMSLAWFLARWHVRGRSAPPRRCVLLTSGGPRAGGDRIDGTPATDPHGRPAVDRNQRFWHPRSRRRVALPSGRPSSAPSRSAPGLFTHTVSAQWIDHYPSWQPEPNFFTPQARRCETRFRPRID